MIISFKVGNYKSIKDPIILNFNATSLTEHRESNVIENGSRQILKTILLYGPNASGKSKILDAFNFFQEFILESTLKRAVDDRMDLQSFKLSKQTAKKPSLFELTFIVGTTTFRYGFETDTNKVHKEWLFEGSTTEKLLFIRINQEIKIDNKYFEDAEGLQKRTRKNALFLSVASQWNVSKAQKIDQYIGKIFNVHGINDGDYRDMTIDLMKDNKYVEIIQAFIKKADLGINHVDILDAPITFDEIKDKIPEEMRERFKIQFEKRKPVAILSAHDVYDNDKKSGIENFSFMSAESEGTKKYFRLVGLLIVAIKEGRPIIIDEFDARLHSLLSKAIIKLFNSDKIKTKAQLIVASHDTSLISRDILRRDQIYFVDKDIFGATNVTTLAEFKPRKETPFDKNYLDGKYGGIPFIDDLESVFSNGEEKE
jgi:AAA15 family ATPase/GTPase